MLDSLETGADLAQWTAAAIVAAVTFLQSVRALWKRHVAGPKEQRAKAAREAQRLRDEENQLERNTRITIQTAHALDELRIDTHAMRTLCLTARNGGKPFPPDEPIFVSCLDQKVARHVDNTWKEWQRFEADPAYRKLIADTLTAGDKGVLLFTRYMEPSTLQGSYVTEGVCASIVFGFHWERVPEDDQKDKLAYVYVSINFGTPRRKTKDEHGNDVLAPLDDAEVAKFEAMAENLWHEPDRVRRMASTFRRIWTE